MPDNNDKELIAFIELHGGYWDGEDKASPIAAWQAEVASGDTRLGYWRWALQRTMED